MGKIMHLKLPLDRARWTLNKLIGIFLKLQIEMLMLV